MMMKTAKPPIKLTQVKVPIGPAPTYPNELTDNTNLRIQKKDQQRRAALKSGS